MQDDTVKEKLNIKIAMNKNGIKKFKICSKCNICNLPEKTRCIKCKQKL